MVSQFRDQTLLLQHRLTSWQHDRLFLNFNLVVLDVQLRQCAYIPILYIIYYTYLLELLVMFFRFIIVNFTSFCGKLLGILCTLTIGIFVIGMDVFIIVLYLFG